MSVSFAIFICMLAVLSAFVLSRFEQARAFKRFQNLDGLRGVAAVSVMISHASFWYGYYRGGAWGHPPAPHFHFYTHLGSGAVAMFFMLTGFLFWGKVRTSPTLDWERLYRSRVFRIFPMYATSTGIMLLIAAFVMRPLLAQHLTSLLFSIATFRQSHFWDRPYMFGILDAGVTWTLAYEWFFYFSLPVQAGILYYRKMTVIRGVLLTGLAVLLFLMFTVSHLDTRLLTLFVCGILAYEFGRGVRWQILRERLSGTVGAILIVLFLVMAIHYFSNAYASGAILLYAGIFGILVAGNTLFGLLTSAPLRILGDISYSVYLLHGIVLYFGFRVLQPGSIYQFWLSIGVITVVTILLANMTYRFIERPCMLSSTSS